jgi:hypothetical protein
LINNVISYKLGALEIIKTEKRKKKKGKMEKAKDMLNALSSLKPGKKKKGGGARPVKFE